MPVIPAPEPWRRARKQASREYDMANARVSFYDARHKLVGWVIVREGEKVYGQGKKGHRRGAVERTKRILTCVNACRGLPSELLEGEGVLSLAINLMRQACRFGDLQLNTLQDRIALNMEAIYHGTFLTQETYRADTEQTL